MQYDNNRKLLLQHDWERGMIINAIVHEEDSQPGKFMESLDSKSISAYGPVFTKTRYLIVVRLFEKHYQCVPLFTHQNKGLVGKEHYQHEFISIRDGRLSKDSFRQLSNRRPLVTSGKGPNIDPLSVVHLSQIISRRYDLKVNCCGSLTEDSTKQLLVMIQKVNDKGMGL